MSEKPELHREQRLDARAHAGFGVEDEGVAEFEGGVAARQHEVSFADDGAEPQSARQAEVAERVVEERGAFLQEFGDEDFAAVVRQGVEEENTSAPQVSEHGREDEFARVERAVQSEAGDHGVDGRRADERDRPFRAEPFGERAGEDIGLVAVGDGDGEVGVLDIFFFEGGFVEDIAAAHDAGLELLRGAFRLIGVSFNELAVGHFVAEFGVHVEDHVQRDIPGAEDGDSAVGFGLGAGEGFLEAREVGALNDKVCGVAWFELFVSVGGGDFGVAFNGDEGGVDFGEEFGDFVERTMKDGGCVCGAHADEERAFAGERQYFDGAGDLESASEGARDFLFGRDDAGGGDAVFAEEFGPLRLEVCGVADAGEPVGNVKEGFGDLACDHIDFVVSCDGDEHLGFFGAGAREDVGVRGVSDVAFHVEVLRAVLDIGGGGVYDGDGEERVALEVFYERVSDEAGAADDDVHGVVLVRGWVRGRWRR